VFCVKVAYAASSVPFHKYYPAFVADRQNEGKTESVLIRCVVSLSSLKNAPNRRYSRERTGAESTRPTRRQ
jgi:hypothetical protein